MKEQIFKSIDESEALAIELETALSKIPAISPANGGQGELDKCLCLEAWLKGQGISALERYDAPDPAAKGGVRPNLIATIPGKNKAAPCLWIMSHLDVVPPGEAKLWQSDPWTVKVEEDAKGKKVIARGVEDNQQGLVSSVVAALALLKNGVQPERTVKLLFVADEEMGSFFGIQWLLSKHPELFGKDDMALVPDGGDPKGETIEIAEKTMLWFKAITKGKQAHASMPEQGNNAFVAGSALAVALHKGLYAAFSKKDPLFGPDISTFEPTKKDPNVPNINTLPGEDVFYVDCRILPCYTAAEVLAEAEKIKGKVEAEYGVSITLESGHAGASKPTAPDAPLVKFLSGAVKEVYGYDTHCIGIGGGTVGAYLRNAGIQAAVWSPMGDCAHQPNEYAYLANILGAAKVMALLML
jgi:succinyl-diaminopimelate desuccinylase